MSQLAALLGTYAVGHSLEHGGRTYTFKAIDQATKVALTKAYFKRAREAVYALAGEVPAEVYADQLSRVNDQYTRGDFDFPQGATFNFFLTAGLPQLVELLTGEKDAADLVQQRQAEVTHLVLCVVLESFPDVKKKLLHAEQQGLIPADKLRLLSQLTPASSPPCNATGQPA